MLTEDTSANSNFCNKAKIRTVGIVSVTASLVVPMVWLALSYRTSPVAALILFGTSVAVTVLATYGNRQIIADNTSLLAASFRDSLTGLYNHSYFQESLERAITKADVTRRPVSLLAIDIDNFSWINNSFGHLAGDKVLTVVGETVKSTIGVAHEACRLSGNKIYIVMPDSTSLEAQILAENLKSNIGNAVRNALQKKTIITMTIGISIYPTLADSKDGLISTADGALYWGKYSGKNTLVVFDPEIVIALSAEERASKAEEKSVLDIVLGLAEALEVRDPYTKTHSQGVSFLAGSLAQKLGFDEKDINKIEAAGMLHDIGKIGVPDAILNKPGRLTPEEIEIIKNHPVISAHIIQSTSLKEMVPAIKAHHERWDGNGYPDRLKGEEIPLEARILAVADTFNAMTTDRPYRNALSIGEALLEINNCAGTQFDPEIAEVFISMFSSTDHPDHIDLEDQLEQVG